MELSLWFIVHNAVHGFSGLGQSTIKCFSIRKQNPLWEAQNPLPSLRNLLFLSMYLFFLCSFVNVSKRKKKCLKFPAHSYMEILIVLQELLKIPCIYLENAFLLESFQVEAPLRTLEPLNYSKKLEEPFFSPSMNQFPYQKGFQV